MGKVDQQAFDERLDTGEKLRLFFAFDIPSGLKVRLERARHSLIEEFPKSRWVRPEGQHLTVAFLGDTEEKLIDGIVDGVAAALAETGPIAFRLHGAGFFPNPQHPRNAWIGGESTGGVETVRKLGEVLSDLGIKISSAPWHLHLTQARFSKPWPPRVVQRFTEWVEDLGSMDFSLEYLMLYSSTLERGGARYSVVGGIPLR